MSYCICCHVSLTSNLWQFLIFCLSDLDNLTSLGQLFCNFLQTRFVWCFLMVRLVLYILSENTAEMMLWRVGFLIVHGCILHWLEQGLTQEVLCICEDTKGPDHQAPILLSGHRKIMFCGISCLLRTSCGFEEGKVRWLGKGEGSLTLS